MPLLSKVSLPNLRARSKSDAAISESIKRSNLFRRGSNDQQDDSIAGPFPKLQKKTSFPSLRLKRQQDAQAMDLAPREKTSFPSLRLKRQQDAEAIDLAPRSVAPRSLAKMLSLPSLTRDPNKKGLRYRHEQPPPVPPVPVIDEQYKEIPSLPTEPHKTDLPPPVPIKGILVTKSDAPHKSIAGLNIFSRHQSTAFERPPPVIRHHREIKEQTSPRYTTEYDHDSDVSSISDYGDQDADADADADYSIRSPSNSTRDASVFSTKSIETCGEETRVSNESYSSIDESANWKPPKLIVDKRLPVTINEAMQMRGRSSSFPVNTTQDFAPRKMSEPVVPSIPMQRELSQDTSRAGPFKSQSINAVASTTSSSIASKGSTSSALSCLGAVPTRPARPSNLLLEHPSKTPPDTSIKTYLPERLNRLDRISYMVGKSFMKGLIQRPNPVNEFRVEAVLEDPSVDVEIMPSHPPKPSYMNQKPRLVEEPSYLDQMMDNPNKTFSETVSWKSPQRNVPMQFSRYDYLFEDKEDKKEFSQKMPILPPVTRPRTPEPIPETVKVRSFRLGGAGVLPVQSKTKTKKRSDVVSGVVSDWTKLLLGEAFDRAGKWQTVEEEDDDDHDDGAVLRVREHEKGVFEVVM